MNVYRTNLIHAALATSEKVQTGNWIAQRKMTRPNVVVIYRNKIAIMEVDAASKEMRVLTYKKQGAREMESIRMILDSVGVKDVFVPARKFDL